MPLHTMFSSTFLSGGNPLSAMSSAVNKFSLFGDESGQDKQQEAREQKDTKRQQDGVLDTQGPPKESKPQQPGVGMGEAGMGGPQRQDMGKALPPPKGLHGGGAQQQDPPLCPICKNTELNFISKGPPNHNTCTQCKSAVCRLCGFSPPDAATEWLCLNCQMQRAVGGVEPPTPPTKKLPTQPSKGSTPSQPSGKRSPSPAPNKDTPPGKGLSSANQQTKLSDSQKPSGQSCSPIGKRISATTAPASQQTPSQQQTANETPSPVKSKLSTKTDPPVEQSGFFGFGFGSAHGQSRATSPSPQPPVSAVSEKVLGFGSSFFSSASNLISSAVQDEKSTTASKDSTKPLASQAPDEKKTEQKKSEETQPTKATVAQTKNKPTSPQPQKADRSSPKPFPQSCPICKVDLKKDPPNYNTCTECKNIVCTQCGFNPMPHQSEGKDWLCLNCQTQRALQSEGTHLLKPQPQPQDAPTQVKDAGPKQKQTTAQPSKSTSTNKTSTSKEDPRNQNAQQKPPTHQTAKSNLPPQKGVPPQEDSGFFRFGFGGARSRSPSPQPAVSAVSGRVLGFGSSFLSSASNLISSAVQDEPSTTPSTSCKDSTVSQNSASATSTPPASHKESAAAQRAGKETKPSTTLKEEIPGQQNDQQPKTPLTEAKMPELSLYMPKLDKDTQPLPKACPLCKAEFKKDPPNYKICTECKKPVCNLCGFNPMPHQTELIEWLCLNCQTQRAVGHSPVLPKKASVQPHHSGKSDFSTPQKASPKATPPQKDKKAKDIQKLQDQQAKASNGTPPVHKPQQQETEKPQVDASKIKDDSGFFGFGFGGTRARSPSPQPAMSAVSEKVLGFGSSFLSSASNLISAAVQDDASTTPPTSRKGSSVSHIPHKTESAATTPVTSHKAFEPSHDVMETSHPPKSPAQAKRGQEVIKPGTVGRSSQHLPQTCLLCKTEIKKDLSNYSTCTECKNTVCNLCGFNPMPHQTKIQEWLCLSCHTQRASDTSSVLSQSQANKISTNSSSQKMDGAVSEHPQKEKDIPDETIQKGQTAHAVKQPEDTSIPAGEKQVTVTPTANEITQQQPRLQEDTEKSQNQTSKTFKDETPQENSGFFGIGGVCPQSQSPQPAASAVAGNVLDFGSSFLSSASNLISSTVLDEPSTTPPSTQKSSLVSQSCTEITTPPHSSRKGSAVPQTSELSENSEKRQTEMIKPQGEQNKKETIQEEKDTKIHQGKGPFKPEPLKEKESPHALPKDCPLCKVEIKKDPANYSTCTECKTIVCLCCGFNPTPHKTEAKEWVCLNCQMQRAPDPSPVEHQPQDNKLHPPSSPKQKKDTTTKDKDKKALANEKPEGKKDDPEKKQPLGSPATKQATQKEHPKEELPEKDQQTKNETSEPSKSAHSKEETGFLGFSFGTRSRPTSPQPAVAGKVLGFGSSILSSASNLLSSAVQDGPFTTPPPSRKGSTVSQTSDKSLSTPPMSRKGSEVSHISTTTPLTTRKASAQDSPKMNPIKVTKPPNEQNQEKTLQEKKPDDEKLRAPSLSILMDITESDTTKGTEPIQPLSKVCPLCKMELRKDPPNYNICTECKNTVCDLCGFNPMPDHTEVKQWLCLQCQMLQASGPPQLTQPQPIKVPPPVAPQEEGQGQCSVQSPSQLQDLKSPLQQGSEEDTSPPKPIVSQTEPHKDKSAFFGSSQPAVSAVSVKVLGFSSSIISSASNLISSAVQDESSRIAPTSETSVTFPTPATSHKGAAISDASEKVPSNVDAISTQQLQEKKARRKTLEIQSINEPSAQERKDESLSEPLKACPLCTVKFKTDPPNFNTCTFCKSTVCNLCGFNPMPQQSEVKEWLCLNCQIQRVPGPPPVQPQANKAPPPASPQKKETSAPDALQKESNPQTVATYKDQRLSLPAKVEDPLSAKSQEPTSISTSQPSPAKSPPPQKAEPPKKESSFFGFGGPRSQSPSSQPSVSAVPGKVLGFGSSIFSSASNLITSVVQNEPSTTPPTSRKGSIVSQTAVKPESTPPASRKESVLQIPPKPASSAKTNAPDIQKQEENKPANDAPNAQSTKAPSAPVKEDENLSKHPNLCPLCKDKFNEDPPNYNTCSFCKATVCNMCGFNTMPHQTEVKEWLCLNCQMQRAPGSPPSGQLQQMAMKEPPTEMEVSNPDPTQKKTGSAKELNQKPAKPGKPQEELTSVEIQKPSTTLEGKQHSVSAPHTEEQSAVSGKALGFSSSFFSSASNLISSAVQDKSSATPPTTHKDYTFTQSSIKNSPTPPSSHKGSVAHKEEGKHSEVKSEDQLAKTQVSLMEQEPSLLDPPRDCPLCKVDLKKDPPNYNSCTQCKKIVCNLCGFSPIPQQSEVKEWLCLNCQVQRVPDPPPAKLQSHTNKAPPSASPTQKRPSPDPSTSQESSSLSDAKVKNDLLHATGKPEDKPVSAESLKSTPVPSTQPPPSAKPTLPQKAETSKEESGFFGFHLGAARSRPASPQPAVSAVSGKVFGFGSSFLSSASSLISSAVQGESSTTPPTSRKASTVSQTSAENTPTPPTARKGSVLQKQEEKRGLEVKLEDQLSNAPITSVKKEAPLSEPISICPICKGDLKKDQPNYNTCTECKNTVCNLCGFTPVPQHSEVKEWLCLNCQVQRAPDSPPSQFQSHTNKAPPSAPPTQKRETSLVGAPEEKTSLPKDATAKDQKSHMTVKPEDETVSVASQKSTPVPTQQPPLAKSALPQKVERSKNNSGFFGFARSRSPSPQPVVSAVSGKVRGFGSSFLSSASSLISSAVQDDPATTPPTSRKGSVISQTSSKDIPILSTDSKGSVVQIKEEKKKTEITTEDQSKVSPSLVKKDAPLLESPKACPLCKAELKDNLPNYNTCTECKNTVCNLCGFHPMPHETEVEWLCLNCQIKRAPGAKQTTQQAEEGPCPTLPQLAGEPEVGEPEDKPAEEIHTKKPTPPQSPTAESASLPKVEPYKEESGSFGGTHSQPPSSQSADSAISTFVKTTPIPPISQKENLKCVGPEIIPQGEETKTSAEKTKLDEKPFPTDMVADESPSNAAPSKAQHVACPLCMMELNVGLDKATNYKTCTECKNTVCNNCGFNPIPHQTEANEWLCLNCQTQRALKGLEPKGSPVTQPDIVSTSAQQTRTITPISATDACEITETDTVQVKETEVEVSEVEDKTSQKEETHVAWAVEHGPGQMKQFSEELPIMEDQKAAIPQKTVTEQSVSGVMSAMQDEPSITSPHSRKGSTVSQASIKTDTPPTSQKASVKTPPISRKGSTASQASLKMPSTADTKPSVKPDEKSDEESTPSETAKLSEPLQPVPRSRQSNCPICKVDLNIGSEDSPNFNTCTECKNNACVQCGMDTMPYQTKVKKWLCLNCKIQQKIEMEPSGTPIPKPLPTSLEKESQSLPSVPMLAEPKASDPSTCVDEKNIHIPAILKKDVPAINPQQETSAGIKQSDMNPQNKEPQQETNPESAKSQPELTKRTDSLAKSGPPPQSKGPKQDSGFTGLVFGGGKSQPSPPKISDSTSRKLFGLGELAETARSRSPSPKTVTNVSGRFLGFGTSIISSASNLISSAVQDERAASPPTSRKGSTASQSSVKCSTPPPSQNVSKMPPAEPKAPDSKKLNEKKIEEKEIGEPGLAKLLPANAKQEAWPDPAELSATAKAKTNQLLCPLCKVALNVETNDPPNYNTCTQCKNVVCCLCGFNPMPHLSEVEWLCLNCQTQRALQQQMRDTGQNSTSSVRSIEPDPKAQAIKTSVPSQAIEATPGLIISKNESNQQAVTVSSLSVGSAHAAGGPVHTADVPPDKTVDKKPEWKCEIPQPAVKEEKKTEQPAKCDDSSHKSECDDSSQSVMIPPTTTMDTPQEALRTTGVLVEAQHDVKEIYEAPTVVKLPFTGSCRTQPPATTQPGNQLGSRDDHSKYDNATTLRTEELSKMKASVSNSNFTEIGLFTEGKNEFAYQNGTSEAAIDLTSGKVPAAFPELYSDATLEAIAASLDALVSPNYPTTDDTKSQLYQAEREFLQLEKLKQLCLAEELEWERHEIQRYREQEQIIVQKELEELQSMKQKLLMQQEEERKAHLMLQQETFAQQQLQLEQIHQLQKKLQQQLQEQKMYSYGIETNEGVLQPTTSGILDPQYTIGDNGQYWPVKDDNSILSVVTSHDPVIGQDRHTASSSLPESEAILKDTVDQKQNFKKLPSTAKHISEQNVDLSCKKIAEGNVKTDEEDGVERPYSGRKRRSRRSVDSCVQTDDEDQDEWDVPVRSRRRSRSRYADGERGKGSKVSSIAIQTVAEISVQTDHSGTINRSPVRAQVDTTVDLHKGGQPESDSDVTSEKDKKQSTPVEIGVSTQLKADGIGVTLVHKSPNVLYSPVSPVSPGKGTLKILSAEPSRHPTSPRSLKGSQRSLGSLSDPKSLSPTTDDRIMYQYSDAYSSKGSQNGTTVGFQKKVKRTLPHPPPEDDTIAGPSGYSTGSARRRMCRTTTLARAKILQDIDKELDLVERESSKLRKKQAELDEEEKEIDAKLRYLEMGINRRKEALLKEREKRERAYLQGVAEERDYMSDSEVSNIRGAQGNGHGLERPRTAPQSEFNQFVPPQTEADSQYAHLESPYSHYQYASQTGTTNHYSQQTLYQQQSLYHQQTSPYQTQSVYSSVPTLNQQSQQTGYDHASQLLLMQQKNCQTTLSELETKINTNYEVIRNQPLLIVPTSTDYGVSHLGGKYSNLELRMGLEERGSMASSPMSSISAESFYADIDHHNARNYVMIDDIGELTKSSPGLGSSFNIPDKDMSKTDRLLRAAEVRRTADVADFLGPLQAASRLHSYGKPEEDSMEEPYELKLLQQQIKQEFRRGTDGLEQLTGLPHYLHSDSFRHFPKSEKYSIGRLTLEKQAAKQLPASVLYQKQLKNKRALIDPKITKFSPIQETRDLEPDYSSFLASTGSAMGGLSSRARLLQDEITFGLRKNIAEQQKYLGSSLSTNLAQSLNLGQSLNLSQSLRTSLQEDGTYPSVTRSRPSSRPSSAYGLDLSIKRDLSSSSLRLKAEGEGMDSQFGAARAKPTSLPISQSRGRIPIVAQNSEEESPLSPVGQPMGMARASAGPLPPISADSRDQFGSSHSLPEVQQHMREESRTRGYDRDIAFIMDDLQGAMSDSEASGPSWKVEAYHLQHEETDWFDKPREEREGQDRRRIKAIHYPFPHTRIKLQKDPKDHTVSGSGFGIRVVGGKEIPGTNGEIGAYIAKVLPGGTAEHTGKIVEGMQVLEWSGIPLIAKTYEEVQSIVGQQNGEAEICVRLDLNMLSDSEHHQQLELHPQFKTSERQRSPGVDPKQLAAELQKVSQQQAPASVLAVLEKAGHLHSATTSDASSGVPSPGQPGSPSVNKKRHSSKVMYVCVCECLSMCACLQINYDKNMGNLIVHVLQARNLSPRDNNGYSDPFVKVYLLPGRGQVMVVQNASAENKRRTKYVQKTQNPEWNQTVIYKNIHLEQLKRKTLEVTVWDYDRYSSNDFLGEVLIDLSNTAQLDNMPRWHPLKEQSESIHHGRGLAPQGGAGAGSQGGQGGSGGSAGPGGTAGQPSNDQSPKTSVIKSRSHGIFPDPAKDTQVPTIEKSHSSPGSSKSSSEGHLRSRGPSRSQSKSSVTQTHLEEAGNAIAAAEAAVQQGRLQPNRATHRLSNGDGYTLDSEDGTDTNAVDSAIFQVPQLKTIPNGLDKRGSDSLLNLPDSEVKNQIMGEIKVALKKEMKTEGEQLVLEILQCRNITYKFKSPDHLPDLYVKLYVVNVATQKRIIKKKTRVCRHDREPSFNETFRFSLNPTGHSIQSATDIHDLLSVPPAAHTPQLFLVSNGGKFVKKTLIGEAYIWLDKVDMRKRAVSWHELVASSPHTQP
ncbi:hypothetical protein P4O66_018464 [Electrophorus voltai]|uniref:Protein piccolo n=1 Tax=Electrophorus voltai TaxID=2609070 RepID=A0AAD9DJQ5_9TELE|nr:hypothetical protein P4O66_018464 [Electrophorus voltai]